MKNRIIFYYQTFTTSLKQIINLDIVTHIHLSAIHFGIDNKDKPYIHLNDYDPDDSKFNQVWNEIDLCKKNNIKIILMLGGAGGAFNDLFNDYDIYYPLLKNLIINKKLDGIDLDVEEQVDLNNIKKLINNIVADFGADFIISMAPVQYAIEEDVDGMGGFKYKDLLKSVEGKFIDYLNVQCYGSYQLVNYENMINNNYNQNQIVMGMIFSQNMNDCYSQIQNIKDKYNDFGGVFIWEYCFAEDNNPSKWAKKVNAIINPKYCSLQ